MTNLEEIKVYFEKADKELEERYNELMGMNFDNTPYAMGFRSGLTIARSVVEQLYQNVIGGNFDE